MDNPETVTSGKRLSSKRTRAVTTSDKDAKVPKRTRAVTTSDQDAKVLKLCSETNTDMSLDSGTRVTSAEQVVDLVSSETEKEEAEPKHMLTHHDRILLDKMVYRTFIYSRFGWALRNANVKHRHQFERRGLSKFRVASYNVLSQDLIQANPYLYYDCDPEILDWEYRKRTFLREFDYVDASVLCLQEVHHEHYDTFFHPQLKARGYEGYYLKRTGDQKDGCATFFKKAAFTAEQIIPVKYYRKNDHVLDRHNVAIVLLLSLRKHPDIKVCVSNTHLLFNPRRGDVRLAQLMMLLAEIDKVAYYDVKASGEPMYHPVIMCGDMNSEPYCDLYRLIADGLLKYRGCVIGGMSGQGEYGAGRYLAHDFLQPSVGITDQCQYVEEVRKRFAKYMARQRGEEVVPSGVDNHQSGPQVIANLWLKSQVGESDKNVQDSQRMSTCETTRQVNNVSRSSATLLQQQDPAIVLCGNIPQGQKIMADQTMGVKGESVTIQEQNPAIVMCSRTVTPAVVSDSAIISEGYRVLTRSHTASSTSDPLVTNVHHLKTVPSEPQSGSDNSNQSSNQIPGISHDWSMQLPTSFLFSFGSGTASHHFPLRSVYKHSSGNNREVTTHHSRANCTVDYIFYSQYCDENDRSLTVAPGHLRLCSSLKLLVDKQMDKLGGLPNRVIASDHLMLCATFVLGFNTKT